jgi:hypothetical protein
VGSGQRDISLFDGFQNSASGGDAMSKRLFDQDRLERHLQGFQRHDLVGRRPGADTNNVCRPDLEHFLEIGKGPKSRIFPAELIANLGTKIRQGDRLIGFGSGDGFETESPACPTADDADCQSVHRRGAIPSEHFAVASTKGSQEISSLF